MWTKSKNILCVIVVLTIVMIAGCIFWQREAERTIQRTIDSDKRTMVENKRTIEIETDKEDDANQAVEPVSLGNFKLTAYCSCSLCCGKWANNRPVDENGNEIVYGAIGERLKEGYSIAVDPKVIPYRTEVVINGHTYKAQDCGGAIKGNRIDVYFNNHQDALNFGVQYAEVFVMPE